MIFTLRPEARARINATLMGATFLGAGAGSAAATAAWQNGDRGWVSMLGSTFAAVATSLQLASLRRHRA